MIHNFEDNDILDSFFLVDDSPSVTVALNVNALVDAQDDEGITIVRLSETDLQAMLSKIQNERQRKKDIKEHDQKIRALVA